MANNLSVNMRFSKVWYFFLSGKSEITKNQDLKKRFTIKLTDNWDSSDSLRLLIWALLTLIYTHLTLCGRHSIETQQKLGWHLAEIPLTLGYQYHLSVTQLAHSWHAADTQLTCSWHTADTQLTYGHLICTLISENQGLEKLRSVSNLKKISGPAHLNFFSVHLSFFSVCHLDFFRFMV